MDQPPSESPKGWGLAYFILPLPGWPPTDISALLGSASSLPMLSLTASLPSIQSFVC